MLSSIPLTRRQSLTLIAVSAGGAGLLSRAAFAQASGADPASGQALMPGADVCVLTPEVTEGPYYFDPELERADITEGRPGIPLRLRLQVVDQTCQAMEGARVDVWHCDATGLYSGYAGQGEDGNADTTGETFMRGTLFSDGNGLVEFLTVYPGWYRGRTTHIHFKVYLDQNTVLTGQIFFPDALSEFIYRNVETYGERSAERDTLNTGDSIANQATHASFAYVKELSDAYLAAMIVGVDPNAVSTRSGPGGPGGGDRPAGPPPSGAPGGGTPRLTSGERSYVPGAEE